MSPHCDEAVQTHGWDVQYKELWLLLSLNRVSSQERWYMRWTIGGPSIECIGTALKLSNRHALPAAGGGGGCDGCHQGRSPPHCIATKQHAVDPPPLPLKL